MKFFTLFLAVPIFLALLPGLTAFVGVYGPSAARHFKWSPIPFNRKFEYKAFREQFLNECFYEVGPQYWTNGGWQAVHLCGEIVNNDCQYRLKNCTEPQFKLEAKYWELKQQRRDDKIEAETCMDKCKLNRPFEPTCAGLVFNKKEAKNMTPREQMKLAYFDHLMQNEHKFVNMTAAAIGSALALEWQAKYNDDFSKEQLVSNCSVCRPQHKCPFCYGITWGFWFVIPSERKYVEFSPQQQKYIDLYKVILNGINSSVSSASKNESLPLTC